MTPEGESGTGSTHEVEQPGVTAGHDIVRVLGNPTIVGRQLDAAVVAWLCHRTERLAGPVEPAQLSGVDTGCAGPIHERAFI